MEHGSSLPGCLVLGVTELCRVFQDILKYTEKAGEDTSDLQKALLVMCVVPKAANDMMSVGRLQGFNVRHPFITHSTIFEGIQSINICTILSLYSAQGTLKISELVLNFGCQHKTLTPQCQI